MDDGVAASAAGLTIASCMQPEQGMNLQLGRGGMSPPTTTRSRLPPTRLVRALERRSTNVPTDQALLCPSAAWRPSLRTHLIHQRFRQW